MAASPSPQHPTNGFLKFEHQGKRLVNPLHLLGTQETDNLAEPLEIDGGHLIT